MIEKMIEARANIMQGIADKLIPLYIQKARELPEFLENGGDPLEGAKDFYSAIYEITGENGLSKASDLAMILYLDYSDLAFQIKWSMEHDNS